MSQQAYHQQHNIIQHIKLQAKSQQSKTTQSSQSANHSNAASAKIE